MKLSKTIRYNSVFACIFIISVFMLGLSFNVGKNYSFMQNNTVVSVIAIMGGPVGFIIVRVTPLLFAVGSLLSYLFVFLAIRTKNILSVVFVILSCLVWFSWGYMVLLSIS